MEEVHKEVCTQNHKFKSENKKMDSIYKMEIVWANVIRFTILHLIGFVGIYQCFFAKSQTNWFHMGYYWISALGITAGAHRLWSHKSYKASLPLKAILACLSSMSYENSVFEWARDHRVHHKFSDTDADPHNSKRGFFFSHIGWLLCRKHPQVIVQGKKIDLSDLLNDPVVMFQHKYKYTFMAVFTFILPTVLPVLLWNESFWTSYCICILRYVLVLHATWSVNSFAHFFGDKPYDKSIQPSENPFVAFFAVGEGFHNYHHTFPMDYSTSEYGLKLNFTTLFIDAMHLLGLAYDRKKMSQQIIEARSNRTGDNSRKNK